MNQIQLFRGLHTQLLERVIGDPGTYDPAVSDFDTHSGDAKALRRRLHFVLYMNYHWAIYERGELREDAVRFDLLEPLFRNPIARSLWVTVRPYWQAVQGETRKGRRFLTMVDDELAKAVQRDEDADDPHDDSDNT